MPELAQRHAAGLEKVDVVGEHGRPSPSSLRSCSCFAADQTLHPADNQILYGIVVHVVVGLQAADSADHQVGDGSVLHLVDGCWKERNDRMRWRHL